MNYFLLAILVIASVRLILWSSKHLASPSSHRRQQHKLMYQDVDEVETVARKSTTMLYPHSIKPTSNLAEEVVMPSGEISGKVSDDVGKASSATAVTEAELALTSHLDTSLDLEQLQYLTPEQKLAQADPRYQEFLRQYLAAQQLQVPGVDLQQIPSYTTTDPLVLQDPTEQELHFDLKVYQKYLKQKHSMQVPVSSTSTIPKAHK